MNAIILTLAIFGLPFALACILYGTEWIAEHVAIYFEEHDIGGDFK